VPALGRIPAIIGKKGKKGVVVAQYSPLAGRRTKTIPDRKRTDPGLPRRKQRERKQPGGSIREKKGKKKFFGSPSSGKGKEKREKKQDFH